MVETRYNMVFGIIGLLVISVFGCGSLIWLICPTPSIIFLPYYLKFLTLFFVLIGGWLGYEIARFVLGDKLFSIYIYNASSFMVYVIQLAVGSGRNSVLILLASCQQTFMTYTIVVCTVKNS